MNNHNNTIHQSMWIFFVILTFLSSSSTTTTTTHAFVLHPQKKQFIHKNIITITITPTKKKAPLLFSSSSSPENSSGYTRQAEEKITKPKREPPYPKIGDVVRFYDVDGGKADGQVLVGKISLIQKVLQKQNQQQQQQEDSESEWLVEITELEDVGDGYYADYPSRKRKSKQTLRNLKYIAPLAASFVRAEDAYKIPRDTSVSPPVPKPMYKTYKLEGYTGPRSEPVNEEVVMADLEKYDKLKFDLLKDAFIAGLAGTIITDLARGLEDAIIYAAGALAGVGYLFFLSIKTDTVGATDAKFGNNISNFRFVLPALVLVGIAVRNVSMGEANPAAVAVGLESSSYGWMSTVTKEQFAAAMLGFLTYRLPLFGSQLSPVLKESAGGLLPGSAGVALQMAQNAKENQKQDASSSPFQENLTPVLLVCGPSGTGKTSLIQKLIEGDEEKRFVEPKWMDRVADGASFERLENRGEFLEIDSTGRFGLTKEGIMDAVVGVAPKAASDVSLSKEEKGGESDASSSSSSSSNKQQVVVVDANVDLAKKLVSTLTGARLVGVWIGLDSLDKFESRLNTQLENGALVVPEEESKESFMRVKIREIVKDIEYGVVSGIFEFTILNDEFEESLVKLREAAEYCFK